MTRGRPIGDLKRHFEGKLIVGHEGGHWSLDAKVNNWGYCVISIGNGRTAFAHRVAYELYVGPIPAGLVVDHRCEVRWCCNPAHLEPVTHAENLRRAHKVCKRGHDLTNPDNFYVRANGGHMCKPCNSIRNSWRKK